MHRRDAAYRSFGQAIDEASRQALLGFCHTDSVMLQYSQLIEFAGEFDAMLVGHGVSLHATVASLETFLMASASDVAVEARARLRLPPLIQELAEFESGHRAGSPRPREPTHTHSTPTKAVQRVSSFIFRSPRSPSSGSGANSSTEVVEGLSANDGAGRSAKFAPRHRDRSMTCHAWFAVLISIRHVALCFLREMSDAYNAVCWCARYWDWAQWNPTAHLTHIVATSPSYVLQFLTQGRARLSAERRAHIQKHLSRLRVAEHRLVENIGRVHNALQSMTSMVLALSSVVERTQDITSEDGGVGGALEVSVGEMATLVSDGASATSGADDAKGVQSPPPPPQEVDLEDELCAIATHTLHSIRLSTSAAGTHAAKHGKVANDAAVADQLSAAHWGSARDLFALEREATAAFAPEETMVFSSKPTWREAMLTLRRIGLSCARWLHNTNSIVHRKEFPPRGRHWPRIAKYCALLLPLVRFAYVTHFARLPGAARDFASLVVGRFETYVAAPCINFVSALTASSQPGENYRQQLNQEVEALSKMIREYHDDVLLDMTKDELDEISQNVADQNDLGLVTSHYLRAMRRPISSFFFGHLARLLLIQIQHQKIELSRVLISSEDVLLQNDLSFKMMAMTPVACMVLALFYAVLLRRKNESEPLFERLRLCWRRLNRLITRADNSDDVAASGIGPRSDGTQRGRRALGRGSTANLSFADQGYVLLLVHEMRTLGASLAHYKRVAEFLEDLDDVESVEANKSQRIAVLERMAQAHPFFHPLFK